MPMTEREQMTTRGHILAPPVARVMVAQMYFGATKENAVSTNQNLRDSVLHLLPLFMISTARLRELWWA